MSSPILHRLALALQLPVLMLHCLTLAFQRLMLALHLPVLLLQPLAYVLQFPILKLHRLTFGFQRPHLRLRIGQGTSQRFEVVPVHVTATRCAHACSLSRNTRCNGYTYTAFTGTSIVPYRSPRLRPCVRPTSTQLLAA